MAYESSGKILVSYPPERIDFDASAIPKPIVAALEEAITCHSNDCHIAAAIMVRRTLEELCADKRIKGKDLRERLAALAANVVLSPGLLGGLPNLRLLGNDAARVYRGIGAAEVELAIDVTKEVLKSVYQLDDLVARLEALKQSKP